MVTVWKHSISQAKINAKQRFHKLMYKTAVYTLVNGAITHQKPQIWKNVILYSMPLLPKCQCTAEQYHIFYICGFWCVMAPLTSV